MCRILTEKHDLEYFFYPASIALVGASNNPGKAGYQVLKNLTQIGYPGKVYPVNPGETEIAGMRCYASLKDIREPVELVEITTQAGQVNAVVREAVARGDVKAVIVVSAGFSETKTEAGKQMEEELVNTARQAGLRVFGPNCTGVINTGTGLDTTIEPTVPQVRGRISYFSQSGAMAGTILLFASSQPRPLGFCKWAHVGNMCDVNFLDVLSYYGQDPDTGVIVMYMEGFSLGRQLMEMAREITMKKAVLVLKVGLNPLGAQAAFSHTGALAGRDEVYTAAFKQCGITRVYGLRELIDTSKAFSMQPLPAGNRICILTEAGGPGTMAMDELGRHSQAVLAGISPAGQKRLKEVLPSIAIVCRPDGYIDMTAAAMEEHHWRALRLVLDEDGVDLVVFITVPPTFLSPENLATELAAHIKEFNKPVLTCLLAGDWVYKARQILEDAGWPTFDTPEQTVKAAVNMIDRCNYLKKASRKRGEA